MREEVKRDLTAAIVNFERYVKAQVEEALGQKIFSVECYTDKEIAVFLDTLAGIDAWARTNNEVRGIALRVQPIKCWETFTIRYSRPSGAKTEYFKRVKAIESGALYPYYTLQAYIWDDKVRWACVRTKD